MKVITKNASLEPFKTRLPIIYPSLNENEVQYVTKESIQIRKNANYGFIPLDISTGVSGNYGQKFTSEMEAKYGQQNLPYATLLSWFVFFRKYYSLLYSNYNNRVYSSATEYYNSEINSVMYSEEYKAEYEEMDTLFKERGGIRFYKWLLDNYFGAIDFLMEYQLSSDLKTEIQMTQKEWVDCVNNLPCNLMYYADVFEFFNQMSIWHKEFQDIDKCIDSDDCCDCMIYKKYGGDAMYSVLQEWIERIESNISSNNAIVKVIYKKLLPCMEFSINFEKKIEDFGNFTIFSKEYVAGQEYNLYNVCTYENDVYLLTSGKGYIIDSATNVPIFDTDGWVKYFEYYKTNYPNEYYGYGVGYKLSGRTSSSLSDFQQYSIDSLGNTLPGIYTPSEMATAIQPPEGYLIDLPYVLGSAINLKRINDTTFCGDVLMSADVYASSTDGELSGTRTHCTEGQSITSAASDALYKANEMGFSNPDIHVDFTYYRNTTFHYVNNKIELNVKKEDGISCPYGIEYIDHCTLEKDTIMYYLSENECYPIYYYNVIYDEDVLDSETYNKTIPVNMADFSFMPMCYDNEDICTAGPMFRSEATLGFSGPEKVVDNIYIDRGYATALDKHLKITEVSDLDSLIMYGNKSFDLINIEEENNNG